MSRRAWVLGLVGAAAAVAAGVVLPSVVSGDMTYALIWGEQLVHGELTTFEPGPTPHPLAIAFGALVSPLGIDGAYAATEVVAGFAAFGVLVAAMFDLAWRLSSAWGAVAGTLVLVTSLPVLMLVAQAGYDLPFAALVMSALALELARPRRGWLPLGILGAAGLLRPEAWLLAVAYFLWIAPARPGRERIWAAALVGLAPALWLLTDALVMGDPLWSLRVTGEITDALLAESPGYSVGDDLGQALRDLASLAGVLTLCAAGLGLLVWARDRGRLAIPVVATLGVSAAAFGAVIAAGSATSSRYLLVPGCVLVVIAAVAAGSRPAGRTAVVGLAAAALVLTQVLARADAPLRARDETQPGAHWIQDAGDLMDALGTRELLTGCRDVALASKKMIPIFAYFSGRPPDAWESDDRGVTRPDVFVAPATASVARTFLTHRRYDVDAGFRVPRELVPVARTAHWVIYASPSSECAQFQQERARATGTFATARR